MIKQGALAEIYRPQTIEETILPERIKDKFRGYVKDGEIPNLILAGPAGVGKTTIALAAINELGSDKLFINGSLNIGKDTLRNDITAFASSISFSGGRKYVIIDEADDMPNGVQMAFRSFQQSFDSNCGFIFTANYPKRIYKELHSRFGVIDFTLKSDEKPQMQMQYLKRVCWILDQEGISYDKKVLAQLIMKYFPDLRKVLNEIQTYITSENKVVDEGIFTTSRVDIESLFKILKSKDFEGMRIWVAENIDQDANIIFREIYDNAPRFVDKASMGNLILLLGEYQYKHTFVADPEINMVAMLTEVYRDVDFA